MWIIVHRSNQNTVHVIKEIKRQLNTTFILESIAAQNIRHWFWTDSYLKSSKSNLYLPSTTASEKKLCQLGVYMPLVSGNTQNGQNMAFNNTASLTLHVDTRHCLTILHYIGHTAQDHLEITISRTWRHRTHNTWDCHNCIRDASTIY